jgi:hypothetical protein
MYVSIRITYDNSLTPTSYAPRSDIRRSRQQDVNGENQGQAELGA